jgi:hypothetical protein
MGAKLRDHERAGRMMRTCLRAAVASAFLVSCAPKQEAHDPAGDPAGDEAGEAPKEEETAPPATPSPSIPEGEFSVDGTVLKLPIETGCWVIRTLEGTEYEPINLKDEYRNEGMRVRADLRARSDMASTCMVGTIVEIVKIEKL